MKYPSPFRGLAVALLAAAAFLGVFAPSTPVVAACRADFSCDFGPSPYCYFVVRSHGKDRYFRVAAGSRETLYGLQTTSRWCSSTRGYPNGDTCRQSPVRMSCT